MNMTDIRNESDTYLLSTVFEIPRLKKFIGKELADTIKTYSELQKVLVDEYIFTQKQCDALTNGIEDYYLTDDEIMTKYGDK
jgi:hypothetical protein